AYSIGIDACIVQDTGLICRLRQELPQLVLHASTQMGVCNAFGAQFVQNLGCTRVVIARETLPEDVAAIRKQTNLEIEAFCHGALCVAYSGNCYYSSMVSGCSGNRGRCLQLCRKKYTVGAHSGYFLSAKDICLVDKIAALRESGVSSLKIEGRMRAAEYVAETVAVYRAAIDGKPYADGLQRLKKVFNRGDYCAAYTQNPTESVIYSKVQNHIGIPVGKVRAVRKGIAELAVSNTLQKGDGVKYLRNGSEVGGGTVSGNIAHFQGNVQAGDEVRLTMQASLKNAVASLDTRIPAQVCIGLQKQAGAHITLSARNESVTVFGSEKVQNATTKGLTEEEIRRAVGTLGGTEFYACDCKVVADKEIFYPVSAIKNMRKRAVEELTGKLLQKLPEKIQLTPWRAPEVSWLQVNPKATFVQVQAAQTIGLLQFPYDYVILNPSDYSDIRVLQKECEMLGGEAILHLPFVMRGGDTDLLEQLKTLPVKGVVVNNLSQFVQFSDFPAIGGIGLNKLNGEWEGTWIASPESNGLENCIYYAYGKLPYMHFCHCPKHTQGGTCRDCNGYLLTMKDDKKAVLEMRRIKEKYCYGILTPQLPLNDIDRARGSRLLDFTYATDEEIAAVNAQMRGEPYALACTHTNADGKLQ
ncbi:MAG: U32 family peptidase, partial [Clostridiales bacterium]|nr:U32 family peptidase [Clostridiales bacterium]